MDRIALALERLQTDAYVSIKRRGRRGVEEGGRTNGERDRGMGIGKQGHDGHTNLKKLPISCTLISGKTDRVFC